MTVTTAVGQRLLSAFVIPPTLRPVWSLSLIGHIIQRAHLDCMNVECRNILSNMWLSLTPWICLVRSCKRKCEVCCTVFIISPPPGSNRRWSGGRETWAEWHHNMGLIDCSRCYRGNIWRKHELATDAHTHTHTNISFICQFISRHFYPTFQPPSGSSRKE